MGTKRKFIRRMRMSFEGPPEYVRQIYELIDKDSEVGNVHMDEIRADNGPTHSTPVDHRDATYKNRQKDEWAKTLWVHLKPIFERANGNALRHDDPELRNVMIAIGHSPNSLSTVFTALIRQGLIERAYRGHYRMVYQ